MGSIILVPSCPGIFWSLKYSKWYFFNFENGQTGKIIQKCHFGNVDRFFLKTKDASPQVRTTFFSCFWVIFIQNIFLFYPSSCHRVPFWSEGPFEGHFSAKNGLLRIISALGPDRDLIFSRACHTYAPGWFRVHFDDDDDDNDDNNDDDEHDGEDQNGHNSDNF